MSKNSIPSFDAFMNPIMEALKHLGGSGTIEEINSQIIEILHLSDAQLEVAHSTNGLAPI